MMNLGDKMNFPDLETCEAIAKAFPKSEFVWQLCKTPNCNCTNPSVQTRKGREKNNLCKIPAPTCEELGVWLWDNGLWQIIRKLHNEFEACGPDLLTHKTLIKPIKTRLETQARAEAVKQILQGSSDA